MINRLMEKLENTDNPKEQIKIADEILKKIPFELNILIRKAHAQIELEQYLEAINTFNEIIELDSNNEFSQIALNGKGVCFAKQNDINNALKCFNKSYEIDNTNIPIILNIASMYENLNENEKAIEKYNEILQLDPENGFAKFKVQMLNIDEEIEFESVHEGLMKAKMQLDFKNYEKAIKTYKQILKIQQDCIPAFNNQGFAYMQLGKPIKALECYKKAVEYQPRATRAWINIAEICMAIGDFESANKSFEKALEIMPNDEISIANNAFCLMQLEKYHESIEMSERALEINPGQIEIYNNIAWCYESLGNFTKAIETYNKGIKHDPDHGASYNNKAWSLRQIEEYKKAIECYDKAIEIDGETGLYLKNIAATYKEMGEIKKAKEFYDRAIKIDSSIKESFDDI